jgi:hypothetical protein
MGGGAIALQPATHVGLGSATSRGNIITSTPTVTSFAVLGKRNLIRGPDRQVTLFGGLG